jgi:type IV pilus assembly protein PilP
MRRISKDKALLIIFLFLPLIFGLSSTGPELVVNGPLVTETPVNETEPLVTETESPVKIRDPFKSPFAADSERAAQSAPASPILNYNLSDLKLVGIVWGGMGKIAVIEAPDGKCYLIKKNAAIGKLQGIVKKIGNDSLDVQTTVTDYLGRTKTEDITVKLYKEEKK